MGQVDLVHPSRSICYRWRVDIDILFDFRSETPRGGDPDRDSPTLHRYHRLLWGKPLPSGEKFELEDARPGNYLVHRSDLGVFYLSSDAVIATLKKKAKAVVEQLSADEREEFDTISYQMGGMMLFPSNKVDRQMTLNGARGFHPSIADRFDLTLECIRRHYRGEERSPLTDPLIRYRDFFDLFGDFTGYVEHFLLHDLVTADAGAVRFFTVFDDFKTPAVPRDVETYRGYRQRSIDFVLARNQRIVEWCDRNEHDGDARF
jgi:hypothetical protein